jgi:hypothetical protein
MRPLPQRRVGAVVLVGAALLVLAACGSAVNPRGRELTKVALFEKANAICRHANNVHDTFDENGSRRFFLIHYSAEEKTLSDGLRSLVPPAALASDWKRITSGTREFAADLSTMAREAGQKSALSPSLVTSAARAQATALTTAKRDGFVECSKTDLH